MNSELETLRQQLAALSDREAIRDVLTGIARGVDRFDRALLAACIHADARLDMGGDKPISGADFIAALKPPEHPPRGRMHVVTNSRIELGGDVAASETYILSCQEIDRDGAAHTRLRAGRYLDRFERRDRVWKLSERVLVDEWGRLDAICEAAPTGAHRGRPAPDDLSYRFAERD